MNGSAPDEGRLRVAVEASALRPGRTGIGCYVEHLLQALPSEGVAVLPFSNRPVVGHPTAAVRRLRPTAAWLALQASRQAAALRPALVHYPTGRSPRRTGLPQVVTVHDLSPLLSGAGLRRRERWLTAPALRRGVREADAVIAVSVDTARAVTARFPGASSRLVVIGEGPTLLPSDPADDAVPIRQRLDLTEQAPLWLHVGASEPRKRLPELVEAHAVALGDLRRSGCVDASLPLLVLAGPAGGDDRRLRRTVARLRLQPWVRLTGRLPRSALSRLYRMAEVVIAMSLHEGFGLAMLDAMGFGRAVLTSGGGALGELAGNDAALRVDGSQTRSIATGLLRLHRDPLLRRTLEDAALRRAAAFSWQRAAAATADLYRCLAAGGRISS